MTLTGCWWETFPVSTLVLSPPTIYKLLLAHQALLPHLRLNLKLCRLLLLLHLLFIKIEHHSPSNVRKRKSLMSIHKKKRMMHLHLCLQDLKQPLNKMNMYHLQLQGLRQWLEKSQRMLKHIFLKVTTKSTLLTENTSDGLLMRSMAAGSVQLCSLSAMV